MLLPTVTQLHCQTIRPPRDLPDGCRSGLVVRKMLDGNLQVLKILNFREKIQWEWIKPNFVKVQSHKLPNGKTLKVKCGTKHVDRCWKSIKERLSKGTFTRAGMCSLQAQIRSALYEYWYRGEDMWVCTGDLSATYMYDIVSL